MKLRIAAAALLCAVLLAGCGSAGTSGSQSAAAAPSPSSSVPHSTPPAASAPLIADGREPTGYLDLWWGMTPEELKEKASCDTLTFGWVSADLPNEMTYIIFDAENAMCLYALTHELPIQTVFGFQDGGLHSIEVEIDDEVPQEVFLKETEELSLLFGDAVQENTHMDGDTAISSYAVFESTYTNVLATVVYGKSVDLGVTNILYVHNMSQDAASSPAQRKEERKAVGMNGILWGMTPEEIQAMEGDGFLLVEDELAEKGKLTYSFVNMDSPICLYCIEHGRPLKTTFFFKDGVLTSMRADADIQIPLDVYEEETAALARKYGTPPLGSTYLEEDTEHRYPTDSFSNGETYVLLMLLPEERVVYMYNPAS